MPVSPNEALTCLEDDHAFLLPDDGGVPEYLNSGSKSVWVIYPRARRVEVHRPHSVHVLGVNDLFPGLANPIGPLFE